MARLLFIGMFFALFEPMAVAQELLVDVRVNLEQLPAEARVRLVNFRQTVLDYLNRYRWTNSTEFETDEDRIQCQIEFTFLSANINVAPAQYSAQMFIGASRPIYRSLRASSLLRTLDANVNFFFDERQSVLVHNELVFTPLASLLDYYAYLILAFDAETFDKQGGTPYFTKAFNIRQLAQSQATGNFARGWRVDDGGGDNRAQMIQEYVDARFLPFRDEFYAYHYNGLDEFHKDPEKARRRIADSLKKIAEIDARFPRSLVVKRFFEAKAIEIGEIFKNASPELKQEVYLILRRVDPSRGNVYESYFTGTGGEGSGGRK
ncbi:MAG: type IX secretion system protein PorD [Chlorobiales bacterium]